MARFQHIVIWNSHCNHVVNHQ